MSRALFERHENGAGAGQIGRIFLTKFSSKYLGTCTVYHRLPCKYTPVTGAFWQVESPVVLNLIFTVRARMRVTLHLLTTGAGASAGVRASASAH